MDFFVLQAHSTQEIRRVASEAKTKWIFIQVEAGQIQLLPNAQKRFEQIALSTNASLIYSDYYTHKGYSTTAIATIDYQKGSIRDDFDLGALWLCRTSSLKEAVSNMDREYQFAGIYDLRLRLSEMSDIFHINELLYINSIDQQQDQHSQHFAYVSRQNREVQIEMEQVCTDYLQRVGALLTDEPKSVEYTNDTFEYEASVIIPVRNRQKTISTAIESALNQKTNFRYNIIVVDNFSTDNTTNIISDIAENNSNVLHIIPQDRHLGIGGCWDLAVNHKACGRFAIQLDSDDAYQSENTLQTIVDEFHRQKSAMMIGSYTITDFEFNPIPPYLIDHREWSDDNGRNNALRINGLGAPRAFYTPIIREIGFPNVSYGEDYAVGLRISSKWKIGRIYDSIYLCRRWDNNSDSNISIETQNRYNHYKDKVRTIELMHRQQANNQ